MKKIAIVYDWLDSWGGVERMLLELKNVFPDADWYTSIYNLEKAQWVKQIDKNKLHTSFLQYFPGFIRSNRLLSLFFYPLAFESFDFSKYDIVISISSSFAKGIITKPTTKHILINQTPTRWLWNLKNDYKKTNFIATYLSFVASFVENYLRKWDFIAAQRPDHVISISSLIKERTLKYYRRNSLVIYPPFDENYWQNLNEQKTLHTLEIDREFLDKGFYLAVSRIEPYKKIDYLIEVFNDNQKNLVIVGDGSLRNKFMRNANRNIFFLKNLTDNDLVFLYKSAKALITPQEEDFGYVALEAQLFGCPVISFYKSGVTEALSQQNKKNIFRNRTISGLNKTIADFEKSKYNYKINNKFFKKFSRDKFKKDLLALLEN